MGDDHKAESSTTAHQSEFAFVDVMMPILSLRACRRCSTTALSAGRCRYAGVWVGLKCVKDTIESTAVVDASLDRREPMVPRDYPMPPGGLNIRTPDGVLEQEARLQEHKRAAIVAWLRRQQSQSDDHHGRPDRENRHHHARQILSRYRQALDELVIDEARLQRARLAPLQARLRLADRAGGLARIRARAFD